MPLLATRLGATGERVVTGATEGVAGLERPTAQGSATIASFLACCVFSRLWLLRMRAAILKCLMQSGCRFCSCAQRANL